MPLGSLQIGPLLVKPNLILAPLSGVTGSAFRRFIKQQNPGAVGLVFSEFISVEALTRRNRRSLEMCRFSAEEKPIAVQLFGHDIGRMVDAAQIAEQAGADLIDINCGCPVPKVVRKGGGCDLMRQPDHLRQMVSAVKAKVGVPLTVKIRAGWDNNSLNALQIAVIAEECGAQAVWVHARTCKQLYKGDVRWDIVRDLIGNLRVPVVPSGDITSPALAEQAWGFHPAGLMMGRGALANPWLFSDIRSSASPPAGGAVRDLRILQAIEEYLGLLLQEMAEKAVIGRIKYFSAQAAKGIRSSSELRRHLCTAQGIAEFRRRLRDWSERLMGEGAAMPAALSEAAAQRE